MKFSQRIGKTKVREVIQIESIDEILTKKLWNILNSFFNELSTSTYHGPSERNVFFKYIWTDFFNERADRVSTYQGNSFYTFDNGEFSYKPVYKYVSAWFFDCEWYEKLDLIEVIAEIESQVVYFDFPEKINEVFEKEMSAYRIVENKIVQITSEVEIAEIEKAISDNGNSVHTHLDTALNYLSDRKKPDYRNSIKESISAVESFCKKITGDDKTTLGKALAIIEKKQALHPSLKTSFNALYGYTSDASGIRHALTDDSKDPSFEEAKFMLVSCSAFINYLKSLEKTD